MGINGWPEKKMRWFHKCFEKEDEEMKKLWSVILFFHSILWNSCYWSHSVGSGMVRIKSNG